MQARELTANRFVLDPKGAAELRMQFRQDPQAGLRQAARQFEGMMLQMMLKSMRDAAPQDSLMNSEQTRFYSSILDQQLAQNLSGSLGFARLIEQQFGRRLATASAASAGTPAGAAEASQPAAATSGLAAVGAARNRGVPAAASAALPEAAAAPGNGRDFVNRVWPHAVGAADALGVPARFLVAHSALESGWGRSEIRKADGSPTYNLFGVKAGRSWTGSSVEASTTEYVDGVVQTVREKFRAYASYAEAFQDYAKLLRGNPRFSAVLGQQDGTGFARSLQQAGYATDPAYADKLGRIINGSTLRQALIG